MKLLRHESNLITIKLHSIDTIELGDQSIAVYTEINLILAKIRHVIKIV